MNEQAQVAAQAALTVAQQMLPLVLQGMSAGASAASPAAATALALAPVVLQLVNLHSDSSEQVIAQLIEGMLTGVAANQTRIDAVLAAKGIQVPGVPVQAADPRQPVPAA